MLVYALRRLILALPILVGITFISFLVIHLAPGDPLEAGAQGELTKTLNPGVRKQLEKLYELDKPLHIQYLRWLSRIARLDFGKSFAPDGRPVLAKIAERLPVTLLLNVIELMIIIAL